MVCLAAAVLAAGCRKAGPPSAEEQAVARHEREVQRGKELREFFNSPKSMQTRKALGFLSGLAQRGQLPYFSRNDRGVLGFDLKPPLVSATGPYYWSQEFHVILQGSPPRHVHYVVVQIYSDGGLQLHKAWRSDGADKILEETPLVPPPPRADPRQVFLGPMNPGAERGWANWFRGVLGGGSVAIGSDDPATGLNCFEIGITNAVAGQTHHADLRSEMFSLRGASQARGPYNISFAYKLPTKVKPGDNIEVNFRFFGEGDNHFLGQKTILLGSSSGDSEMIQYKTVRITGISPPKGAVKADVWIVANIGGPWTSGSAQFDDFFVTALPGSSWVTRLVEAGALATLASLLIGMFYLRRSRQRAAHVPASGSKPEPPAETSAEH